MRTFHRIISFFVEASRSVSETVCNKTKLFVFEGQAIGNFQRVQDFIVFLCFIIFKIF